MKIKNNENATVVKNTYKASKPPLAFNKDTTNANKTQAVQSLRRPADIVIAPGFVPSNLSSARIRANTGNALSII